MTETIYQLALKLGERLAKKPLKLVTAESCTGGGLAQAITDIAGSSAWFERGYVTYSNLAKQELLGVKTDTLNQYGAVSEAVACAMAEGALKQSHADISIAITGIAGPDGGTLEKPIGTVWFALSLKQALKQADTVTAVRHFQGDRKAVREQSVQFALEKLIELIG